MPTRNNFFWGFVVGGVFFFLLPPCFFAESQSQFEKSKMKKISAFFVTSDGQNAKSGQVLKPLEEAFQDPDLKEPKKPLFVVTHEGAWGDYKEALGQLKSDNEEEAILLFHSFLKRFPDEGLGQNCLYWLGVIYWKKEQPDLAEGFFRKLLQNYSHQGEGPNFKIPEAIYFLAKQAELQNQFGRALYYHRFVIDHYPKFAIAEESRASVEKILRSFGKKK